MSIYPELNWLEKGCPFGNIYNREEREKKEEGRPNEYE